MSLIKLLTIARISIYNGAYRPAKTSGKTSRSKSGLRTLDFVIETGQNIGNGKLKSEARVK